jgi:putative transposase
MSTCPFLPPGQDVSRTFSVPTLLHWRRAFLRGGLTALAPDPREDRGHARALNAEQKTLLLDIRRDHPTVSAELILRTLVGDRRLDAGRISAVTVRRFFAKRGHFHAQTGRAHGDLRQRLPWQRAEPNELWHADVCHGPDLGLPGKQAHQRG